VVNAPTQHLRILKREVGSLLPVNLTNSWGNVLNEELETIDRVIGEVCSPPQIHTIRQRLAEAPPGLILGRCNDG
jgi:hypothetical protein